MPTRPAQQRPHAAKPSALPTELILTGGSLVHRVARELNSALDRQLTAYDLTAQQAALLLLAARQRVSPSQLKDRLGTDTAGMTRLLDRLEAKGLLTRVRHPDDRRAILIEPTAAGRALVPRLAPVFRRVNTRLLAGLGEAEVRKLTTTLQHMYDNLRGAREEPQD
jgi:DNA-binding MarR family transcriptional regulator